MQFPNGISNFHQIITSGSFYVDRTDRTSLLGNDILYVIDSEPELQGLRLLRQSMDEDREQARRNMEIVNQRLGNLRLRGCAVISLGFERICWEEIKMGG